MALPTTPPTPNCSLSSAHSKLQTQHHLLQTANYKPNTTDHLLPTTHGQTQTQHHLLPTAYCLLHTGHLLFPLLFFFATLIANAQLFPVQVTPQLIPPYSLKLSDYQTATNEKLIVNILLTDTQDAGRQVGLKMFIEGQGLSIRSQDFVVGAPPIFLDGGFNLRLTNLDLGAYFALNNLVGISPQQYNRPLPDGRYDFCFEVYDRFSGQRLSRRQCTPVFLLLNDPPFLNLPGRGDLVTATDPQNILFNWTPRHLNATGVRYEFTLKELWDTGIDPQAAFLAAPPLHQETTFAPTLLYGPANLQLLQGKTYAWQVRAVATDGINEAAVFRNNGYSEIYHFRYQGRCDPPRYALSQALNARTVEVTWQPSAHLRYALQFRKKGSDGEWFARYAYGNAHTLHDLEAGTAYEFRVGGECSPNGGFSFGPAQTFTTPTDEATAHYNCGVPPEVEVANQDPLPNLGVNEVFTAGDFPVTVKEVVGKGNGTFSGWGHISVPYLADTRIRVTFNDIQINTDFQLIRGMVETAFDADHGGVESVDAFVDGVVGAIEDIKRLLENFNGSTEQIQQLQGKNEEQDSYVQQLLADESIPQGLRDELRSKHDAYNSAGQGLIEEAKQGGPNPEGYDTANQLRTLNDLDASIEKAEGHREIAIGNDLLTVQNDSTAQHIFLSPAGVPVMLLRGAVPAFYKVNRDPITAYGALAGFTIETGERKGIYRAHKKGMEFTGYKIATGSPAFKFEALPKQKNVTVRIIDKGFSCDHLYFEGDYLASTINDTGTGTLVTTFNFIGKTRLLPMDEQGYSTCFPEIDYQDFTEYIYGVYNYFGRGGFLRKVRATDGTLVYLNSVLDTEGILRHYQYNPGNGVWQKVEAPNYDVDTAKALNYLFGQVLSSGAGHLLLDMAGAAPVAGELFDLVNGAWYAIEGNGKEAAISFASTIPFVYATPAKYVGKFGKLANGRTFVVKFSEEATQRLHDVLKRLDLDANQLNRFSDDLGNKEFAEAIARNPELLQSWKLLENSGRRTDIKTLKFFNDPTVAASRQKILNGKIHEAFPDVPLEELTAIQHYTTNAHLNLNKALRGEIPMTDEYRAFEELLNSGMDKLPKFNGDKVFRGVKGDEAALAKTWKVGDEIPFSDFKSSSTDDLIANDFAGDVVYEISNPKGRNICAVSCLPRESEVLFKSESKFKVKEIKPNFVVYDKDLNPTKVRKIYLEFVE